MRNIELGPVRPVGAVDVRSAHQPAGKGKQPEPAEGPEATVVKSDALTPGEAPVDSVRVERIRNAIESGNYPLAPARIADAMIAAGVISRNGK